MGSVERNLDAAGRSGGARNETANPLPNALPGWVSAQYVKRGGKVYGPYWSRMWRENCVLRKRYVRPADLDAVSAACRAWREMRTRVREFREQARRSRAESAVMVRALRLIEQDPDHGLERLSASDQALLAGIVGSGL